jgi:hypothetical protein
MFDTAGARRQSHIRGSVAACDGKKATRRIVNRQTKGGGRKRQPASQIQKQISGARGLAMSGTEYRWNISSGTETLISDLQCHFSEKTRPTP